MGELEGKKDWQLDPSLQRDRVRPPGVSAMRMLLLIPGWIELGVLVLMTATTGQLPPLTQPPVGLLPFIFPLGLIPAYLIGPRRWAVHLMIIGYEIVFGIAIISSAVYTKANNFVAVIVFLLLPLGMIYLAIRPKALGYFWPGIKVPMYTASSWLTRGLMPAEGPIVIDAGKRFSFQMLAGGLVGAFFGGSALVAAIFGTDAPLFGRIIFWVLGLGFGLPGLLGVFGWLFTHKLPRKLIFDEQGIHWDEPRGAGWSIGWDDVEKVAVNAAGGTSLTVRNPGVTIVRLVIFPHTGKENAQLARFAATVDEQPAYWIPLADNPDFIPLIAEGTGRFRPGKYAGLTRSKSTGFHIK